jgi:hypothetical protein
VSLDGVEGGSRGERTGESSGVEVWVALIGVLLDPQSRSLTLGAAVVRVR